MEPPAQYYERPEIMPQNQFYWDAFWELSTERQIGMGVGPIPRSAITAYAKEFDIAGDELDVFYGILRAMDSHYLTEANSTKKTPEKGTEASADDVEGVKSVIDRIRARASAANKRQRKSKQQQTH